MDKNPLFDDPRIANAAKNIAELIKAEGKPVMFLVDDYMQLVIHVDTELPTPDELYTALHFKKVERLRKMRKTVEDLAVGRNQFIAALSDAFTYNEIHDILPCVMAEVGYEGEASSPAYVVFREPSKDEVINITP